MSLLDALARDGRETAIVGLGKSGVAAGELLRGHGVKVYASELATTPAAQGWAGTLRRAGAEVQLGGHDLARIAKAAAMVVAPGVPPTAPPYRAATGAGVPVLAEVDLGYTALPRTRFVGITGTNGKTTTTSLVAHLMRATGVDDAVAAGNIGLPLCDVARQATPPRWVALELSSFQLHDCPHLKPEIAALLNLAPNHLDRYATLEEYYGDKALLFRNADTASLTISNLDDAAVQDMVAPVPGRHLRFSVLRETDAWFDRDGDWLMLGRERLLRRNELMLLGDHNVLNALTGALVARELGGSLERIADGLRSFRAIEHRVEPVREVDGVLWINDSKSTNVTSTAVAIAALERPFVLLLGGRHKGEPYTRLADVMGGRCRAVVAYGESGDLVEQDLKDRVKVVRAGAFPEVLAAARGLAAPGDAVLLSPACSSYDMFDNYEQRGARFRELVEAF
ncbi:MAG TPA: UDP-N-acetylmuramoyl-L-alanine--D-glutamate ligase [Gemmatimonadales bacterium]|nr:UDP-N-acetylmuramoyl-L-alanine--D-glutamate ligase [Gemmatimonadales bacterium]